MAHTWRESARPIIQQVLKDNKGKSETEIKKALREAYPFGMRAYHPYKIWLDEIKVQLGKKKFGRQINEVVPENQTDLFNG
jgi:hypothetical protein